MKTHSLILKKNYQLKKINNKIYGLQKSIAHSWNGVDKQLYYWGVLLSTRVEELTLWLSKKELKQKESYESIVNNAIVLLNTNNLAKESFLDNKKAFNKFLEKDSAFSKLWNLKVLNKFIINEKNSLMLNIKLLEKKKEYSDIYNEKQNYINTISNLETRLSYQDSFDTGLVKCKRFPFLDSTIYSEKITELSQSLNKYELSTTRQLYNSIKSKLKKNE